MASIAKRTTASGEVRWDARVRLGNRVATKTHRTRRLAEEWARRQEDAHRSGELVDPDLERRTLAAYADDWMATRKLKPRTLNLYRDLMARRIGPDLGDVELRSLTPERVRRWWSRQPDTVYSAKAYRLLRSITETAHRDGILRRNPVDIAGAGIERSQERTPPTPAEIAAVAEAADDGIRALVLLAAWCGLRAGEVLGLERRHVDELHGTIRIEQAADWSTGRRIVGTPKSFAGRRTVKMPAVVAAAVTEHLADFVGPYPSSPVAVGVRGGPLTASMLHKRWAAARTAAGPALAGVRFHDLRHAAGTMAAWTSATPREIQEYLGHSTAAAAARYQHAAEERLARITDGLDAIATAQVVALPEPVTDGR
jgi:integrase